METKQLHALFFKSSGVSTDTRKIAPGCLFFALRGDRFDANTFAAEALEKGALAVVIDNPKYQQEGAVLVKDSLLALQELAAYHRRYLGIPILALTGSNGKTTTKELLNVVLSKKFVTGATVGNLNNHIGVPLTLLSFTDETELGIVEMGANHQKEIAMLCQIAQPDYGYITNFGKAHLEGFGGVEGVIKGKSELYDYLRANGKTAIINANDAIQIDNTQTIDTFSFGLKTNADVIIDAVSANPFVSVAINGAEIKTNLIGLYNATNVNAAIAVGKKFGVSDQDIASALESYTPQNNRSQILNKNGNEIILDAYNANPSSMKVAIENFLQLDGRQKVAFLGDMFELGEESLGEHQRVVDLLADSSVEVYFIGKDFYASRVANANFHFFDTFEDFSNSVASRSFLGYRILIKGSRGMALERILDFI